MSVTTVTAAGTQSVTVQGSTQHKITNKVIATPNSEVSHALSSNLKGLIVRARDIADTKISFTSGESGTKYVTIPKRAALELNDLSFASETLYLQTSIATTVEILELY